MIFNIIPLILSLLPIYNGERVKRIVGGSPAEPPPEDDPVVFTNFAGKSARVQGVRDLPHYVFRGIKYAHPPVGKERFLRPRQKFLEGIVNATIYPPPCIQPRPGTDVIIGDEDCLALNVFTPELPTGTEGLPVVVWIHGGGFRYGSASQYGVRHLVGKKLVVVTIQFRLGSLGFLSSGDKHMPGNVALWDMVLAVQWVRNYIGFFGGNPYRIFVMGHDSGASSAHMVALSNVAKGLPAGVIAMSGTAVSHWAMDHTPHNTAHDVAIQNGCPTGNTVIMVKCLQNVPAQSIIRGDSNIEFQRLHSRGFISGLSGDLGSAPVTEGYNDGRSLPGLVEGKPLTEMNKENHSKIPLLAGICKDETKKAVTGYMRNDIIHKLNTIPNFLDEVLIKNLRGVVPISDTKDIINDTLGSLPLNLGNYMHLEKQNLEIILDKVAEVTSDVLFNAPAFLTVERWSKNGAPTFLYSFEHLGKRSKGDAFLKGSPLVGNGTYEGENVNELVGHGDDLAYLFDVNDITGESITSTSNATQDDYTVREIYTQMIADFVRHGTPRINKRDVKPFSILTNNFIQIKAKPQLAENFKFCEMGMWLNIAERLKSSSCMLFDLLGSKVKNAAGLLVGGLGNTGVDTDIGRLGILGGSSDNQNVLGLIGGQGSTRNEPVSVRNPLNVLGGNSKKNQVISNNNLGLGGLFG